MLVCLAGVIVAMAAIGAGMPVYEYTYNAYA
jgi:hypothetical protein